ncbi:MAG: dTDP-4-dehydrorhamnose reductase [Planctomycetota bacterium]
MIWLTGSSGLLGREVVGLAAARGLPLLGPGQRVDVTDREAVLRFAGTHRPRWILNGAAYTDVDGAEREAIKATHVNAEAPAHLAEAAGEVGAVLVHVSTDYVFDGQKKAPYTEDDAPAPLGAYGRSKRAGEEVIRASGVPHVIVRTSWLHGPLGRSFVGTVLAKMQRGEPLRVVVDQQGRPTYAEDLAGVLLELTQADTGVFGTYHVAGRGGCTWFELALEVQRHARAMGLLVHDVPIEPVPASTLASTTLRPAYSVLSTDRIEAALGWHPRPWQDGVARHLGRVRPERGNR